MSFTVRLVSLDFCSEHRLVRTVPVDGQDRRVCTDCIEQALRVAECNLALDRAFHRNHDVRVVGCPYCYPGAIA